MSDLTTLATVKKAAERALERVKERTRRAYIPALRDASTFDELILSAFIEELEASMTNPRSPP